LAPTLASRAAIKARRSSAQIAAAVPQAQQYTFRGAGHLPQMTNADEYVRVVTWRRFPNRRT
jgi:pimeloyl-ACP methyl ester carboxylesterase